MSELTISTADGGRWVRPGSELAGQAAWYLDEEADAIELRLFWLCRGDGTDDHVEVVDCLRVARPAPSGSRSFRFRVPDGPYSFAGSLFTLSWALELVVLPPGETARLDLTVGPRPVEVRVSAL